MKLPVLKIRDANGNFIPINAIRGDRGKSAYEQAKEGGYKGTEEEFIALLNGLTSADDADHYSDFNNPHNVTAEQTGAIPENYYVSADLNEELLDGSQKMIVCAYGEGTINTPFKEGLTLCSHGMVITNAYVPEYATQLCIPSGFSEIFIRSISGNIITDWIKAVDTEWRDNMFHELYKNIYPLVNKIPDIEADVKQANEAIENIASMELLWENASPQSDFAPQTVAVDFSDYTYIAIDFNVFNNLDSGKQREFVVLPVSEFLTINRRTLYKIWNHVIYARQFYRNNNGIYFTEASTGSIGNANPNNGTNIPLKIWGIK